MLFGRSARELCLPDDESLCLQGGRFRVRAEWRDFEGHRGRARALPLTDQTGGFWFFEPSNPELLLKVLDGRSISGAFWVFYGALSNVEYRITVTDTRTGAIRIYDNPAGAFASRGDTAAFRDRRSRPARPHSRSAGASSAGTPREHATDLAPRSSGPCIPSPHRLCLGDGRFSLEVTWQDFAGGTGPGVASTLTDSSGTFWFFDPGNLELMVKLLDGRALGGHYWIFYGSLSNVGFTLTATDHATGLVRSYQNPVGTFASHGDTRAFPAE